MKKIIIIIIAILPFLSAAQQGNIDTVRLSPTLKIKTWGLIQLGLKGNTDSLSSVHYTQIRNAIQASPQKLPNTDLQINNFPASLLVNAFRAYQSLDGGLIREIGNDLFTYMTVTVTHPLVLFYSSQNTGKYVAQSQELWQKIKNNSIDNPSQ